MDTVLPIVITAAIGYFLGSIPFGLLIARLRGVDIRQHGSGNIGATNVSRTLGKKWGLTAFAGDFFKGTFAVLLASWFLKFWVRQHPDVFQGEHAVYLVMLGEILAAVTVILGHNFPVWLNFKGGKGIATSGGLLLALTPWTCLILVVIWIVIFYTTKYVSIASIVVTSALPVVVWLLLRFAHIGSWPLVWFTFCAALLALWRHRGNMQRLLNGTEPRFVKKPKQKI